MNPAPPSLAQLVAQEDQFAAAFAAGDISLARSLYEDDVVYLSPTTRLFGWPGRIVGVDKALEFIQLTITGLSDISYAVDDRGLISDDAGAFVRVRFDFDTQGRRLRSTYVVLYRYRDTRIAQQELYYDPSGELERLSS